MGYPMLKILSLSAGFALSLLLVACADPNDPYSRDPGYVCTNNCAHYCEDGVKGDSCRQQQIQQRIDYQKRSEDPHYWERVKYRDQVVNDDGTVNTYYHGDSAYYGKPVYNSPDYETTTDYYYGH
jgi:hypothetical protein